MAAAMLAVALAPAAIACANSNGDGGESGGTAATVNVTLGASSCTPDRLDLAAGKTTFIVRNPGEGKADTFEIRDGKQSLLTIQNVLGGLARSADANLRAGTYSMHCGTSSSGGEGVIVVTE